MDEVLIKVVNMSITASWTVAVVVLLRLILKKAPRWISCLMWGLVGLRLIFSASFKSMFSILPSTETIQRAEMCGQPVEINFGVPPIDQTLNKFISSQFNEGVTVPTDIWDPTMIATIVWLIGVVGMFVYSIVSYIQLHKTVAVSFHERDNIFLCDTINSPFILGVFRPNIYLPSGLAEEKRNNVIAHEQAHIRRFDHLWKLIGFLLLGIYWFNPILWFAYILFTRDVEIACDEKVIAQMGAEAKKNYCEALICCSLHRRKIMVYPLAFSEVGVKTRIRAITCYKKPTLWILVPALVLCIAAALCLLTDPPNSYLPASQNTLRVASIEDVDVYFEKELSNSPIHYFGTYGVGMEAAVPVTEELIDILNFDKWEEISIDVHSVQYKEQPVFCKSIGEKDGYILKFCIGNVYGGVEWYERDATLSDERSSTNEVYIGGVYYTLPQISDGDMIKELIAFSARYNGVQIS